MVALVEERDREVRDGDPEPGRPVAEHAPGDPGRDPVDAEQRDREQDERVDSRITAGSPESTFGPATSATGVSRYDQA